MPFLFWYLLGATFLGLLLLLWDFWMQRHGHQSRWHLFLFICGVGLICVALMYLTDIFLVAGLLFLLFGIRKVSLIRQGKLQTQSQWYVAIGLLGISIPFISLYLAILIALFIGEYIPHGTARITWVYLIGIFCFLFIITVLSFSLRRLFMIWKKDISF
jgi:hypothetical protein